MKTAYLFGDYERLYTDLINADLNYRYSTKSHKSLIKTLNTYQANMAKLNLLNNVDEYIICVDERYILTPEDIFTAGYIAGLNKMLLVVGEFPYFHPNYWVVSTIPHIKFEHNFEVMEYLAQIVL